MFAMNAQMLATCSSLADSNKWNNIGTQAMLVNIMVATGTRYSPLSYATPAKAS